MQYRPYIAGELVRLLHQHLLLPSAVPHALTVFDVGLLVLFVCISFVLASGTAQYNVGPSVACLSLRLMCVVGGDWLSIANHNT